MNKFKKAVIGLMLGMTLAIGIITTFASLPGVNNSSIIVQAAPATPSDVINSINGSQGGVLGSEVKTKVTGLTVDIQQIVLTVVMGILIVSTIFTSIKFSGAGDDAQAKGKLKNALMYQILGIVFVASYWGLITFGLKNLNMFG